MANQAKAPKAIKGEHAVLFYEQATALACRLMNVQAVPGRFTPASARFHTPCPFGKRAPGEGCFSCHHAAIVPLIRRRTTEAELDARQEAAPAEWQPASLTPYPKDN